MSSTHTWFRKGTEPGTTITLERPVRSEWKIVQKLNEYDCQMEEDNVKSGSSPSYSSTKLLCHDSADPEKKAFMRIYMQIPYVNTESDDSAIRAQQASGFIHKELFAYKALTRKGSTITPRLLGYKESQQDGSGLVPGGFITWFAWEIVPGLRLGDDFGAAAFWDLESSEREQVRLTFLETLPKIMKLGFFPTFAGPKNLVWDSRTNTIFFIGFQEWSASKASWAGKPTDPDITWLPEFRLVKVPTSNKWWEPDWDGDTTGWEY